MTAPPDAPRPGDVVVALPHTLTRATRTRFEAEARAALPAAATLSRAAPEPRLVLDAAGCVVVDVAGAESVAVVARSAAASGTGVVVLDASFELRALLDATLAAHGSVPVAFATRERAPAADEAAGVLRLDDAARKRLAARRKR